MRCGYPLLAARLLFCALVSSSVLSAAEPSLKAPIEVFFSPNGGCTAAIVREISAAKTNIAVQAYSFTSTNVARALVAAHRRGIKVRVVLDKSQKSERYTSATFLKNQGIEIYIDDQHAIAHNKVVMIDGQTVITGSFNFTKAAEERNAENLLIIRDPAIAQKYAGNFLDHLNHSGIFEPRNN